MMYIHQAPVNSPEYRNYDEYFRLSCGVLYPLRSEDKIKHNDHQKQVLG